MNRCSDAAKSTPENVAINFPTHGQPLNEKQKAAQEQKDTVLEPYEHLWGADTDVTWKQLDDVVAHAL